MKFTRHVPVILVLFSLTLGGCGKKEAAAPDGPRPVVKIRFQTDWFPQAEHGGFYQALAKGFYREAGLDVEIVPGGPGVTVAQKMMAGVADIGMSRSDDVAVFVQTGLPLMLIGVTMQHDPQAILMHEENALSSFEQLQGKSIMAVPGSSWIDYLKARYKIEFSIIPSNYGIGQFMADKKFIQQCFITNEPYYVSKNGAKPKTLLIADSGFDPYRVYMSTSRFIRERPEAIRAFVAASTRGWDDFMNGDPSPAFKLIGERNDKMPLEFLQYSHRSLAENKLISGHSERGEKLGQLTKKRLQEQVDTLVQLKLLPAPMPLEKFVAFEFIPPGLSD